MDSSRSLKFYVQRRWRALLSSHSSSGSFSELREICRKNRIAMSVPAPPLPGGSGSLHRFHGPVKRGLDVALSVLGLVGFLPVLLVVAVALKCESPGPVFIRQRRSLGKGSVPFDFYRFRTVRDTPRRRQKSRSTPSAAGTSPAVTRVGRLVREFGFDELPQLLNVLKGEMSLVGPRPLPVRDYRSCVPDNLLEQYMIRRIQAKPGITGLWQISGRSDRNFQDMILLDINYIEHQSLLNDLKILALTVPKVLFGKAEPSLD